MVERNPFVTVIVTGVPGVGKTTVLNRVRELASSEGMRLLVLNFGDFMLEEALARGLVRHRDEIRHLPLRRQLELQELAAEAIVKRASAELGPDGYLLVDTHAVIRTSTGYWPGLPRSVVERLKPDAIVVIEAPAEDIVKRQMRDTTRVRSDLADVSRVAELMQIARSAAMASAVLVSASVYIVQNPEGRVDEAARSVVELLKRLR